MNEKKQQFKRKRTLVLLMAMTMNMVFIFTACSSGKVEMSVSETDTTKDTTKETVKKEVEETSTPEPTAEPTPEPIVEPVEMVSWEEWASQPGEEEPHLVVWNEEKGTQLIVEPDSMYSMEEGDKLAVSVSLPPEKLEAMGDVYVSSEITGDTTKQKIVQTEYGQYWEVILEEKGFNDVYYAFDDSHYMYYIEK